ncbi:FtsQ-type POTRA domain-containing protein [Leucobacter aridicollis]|uniref:FtsQ-type POTRA domain-containing protein n=1 Tax=Leucobacter aridicollis TaxID=283878 RepID=UPI002168CFB0|nr:FtsQ-type POTRA domain-containing protein [Leucobacter aridicollis]MCS3428585.1 cell division protein FtsQ [Leucobacter aridicollis]
MKRPGGFDAGQQREPERSAADARAEREAHAREAAAREAAAREAAERDAREREAIAREREARESATRAAEREWLAERTQAVDAVTGSASGTGATGATDPDPADAQETQDISASLDVARLRGAPERVRALLPKREPREVDPVIAAEKRLRAAERQNKRRVKRETKRFTAESRRRRRRVLIALATVAALVLFVLVGAFTPIMSVREIKVEGATSVNADEVTEALSGFNGVPLALVNENDVLRALEPFPLIQRYAIERVPPSTLIVRIEERVPVIAIAEGDSLRLFDAAGVVLGDVAERPEGVPLGTTAMRNTSSKGFQAASRIVRDMPAGLRAQLTEVSSASGQDVTFTLASGVEVFWGNPEETKRKSLVLETMLKSLGDRPVSHIDVSSTESPIFK